MCGIVAILGRHEVAPLHPRGAEAARVPRLRQRRHRHAAGRPPRPPPRRRQADRALRPPGAATRSAATPASATPAGRPTARPPSATPTRTRPAGSRWCTTASSRTTARCAPSSRPRARSSRPRPTPRPSSSSATASSPRAGRRSRPPAPRWRGCTAPSRSASSSTARTTCSSPPAAARRSRSATATARSSSAPTRWRSRRCTNRIAYLEEGDHAVLTRAVGRDLRRRRPARSTREVHHVPVENVFAEKGPYKHFMAKEMHEQPTVDRRRARPLPHARPQGGGRCPAGIDFAGVRPAGARRLRHGALRLPRGEILVRGARPAAGRDRGRLGVPLPRAAARRRAPSASSSASRARPPTRWRRCATCAAQGGRIVSVVNVETSTIARESDVALPILAGPEIGVASTKAFTCQLTVLATLAHRRRPPARHGSTPAEEARLAAALGSVPGLVARALALEPEIAEIARDLAARPRRALPRPRRRCIRWRSKAR